MGTLCRRDGPEVYVSAKDTILEGVQSNLERRPIGEAGISEQEHAEKLAEKLAGTSPKVNISIIKLLLTSYNDEEQPSDLSNGEYNNNNCHERETIVYRWRYTTSSPVLKSWLHRENVLQWQGTCRCWVYVQVQEWGNRGLSISINPGLQHGI